MRPKGRHILRNPVTFRLSLVAISGLVLIGALSGDANQRGIYWAGAVGVLMGLWPRLIVDENGLTVINVRAHRYEWDESSGVEWRYRLGYPVLDLKFADGSHRVAWAVAGGKGRAGRWWLDQTFSLVRDRWQLATDQLPPVLERYVQ